MNEHCHRRPDGNRAVEHEHLDSCSNDRCKGCQPCIRAHCPVCGREHTATVCAGCLAEARADLREIVHLYPALHQHAAHAGRDGRLAADLPIPGGNATVLAGPAADYDKHIRRRWLNENSKTPARLEQREDELDSDIEPVAYTLGTWEWIYRQVLSLELPYDPDADDRPHLARAYQFLDDNLHRFAGIERPSFADLARDLKQRRAQIEDELYAGERDAPTAVACGKCGVNLVRRYDITGLRDELECPRCHATMGIGEYQHRVAIDYRDNAAYLPASILEERTGIKPATVLVWVHRGSVRRQGSDGYGRQLYDVADVQARAHTSQLCSCRYARPHTEHRRSDRCCLQCHLDATQAPCPHAAPPGQGVAS